MKKELNEDSSIEFILDINTEGNEEVIAKWAAEKNGGTLEAFNPDGPAGGNPECTFKAPNEKVAYAIIDTLYGPENTSRDSNHFHVYGN